jgi:hypothetical protein
MWQAEVEAACGDDTVHVTSVSNTVVPAMGLENASLEVDRANKSSNTPRRLRKDGCKRPAVQWDAVRTSASAPD